MVLKIAHQVEVGSPPRFSFTFIYLFFKLKSRQSGSVQLSFKDGERREKKASFFLVLFVCCDPQLKSLSDEAASFGQSWKTRQFFLFVLLINGGGKGG